ncbi:MAG TPA: GNAT family N-acetyltransferase [Thermoanaerobaculia bacterium]|nr:GNAT family N-acetyltransferase [Thermoanaerobaculia bacterium]
MIALALATQDDDAGIRRLLASTPMPGRIRVRFEREPSYFAGCAPDTQVLVARDGGRVVGVACRTIRKLYVDGVAEDVGYLGQLRVDPAYRGQLLTARGYRVMRELHGDGRARGYYTTIVDGNAQAEGVLVRRSRGVMPRYRFVEKLYTLAIRSAGRRPAGPPAAGRSRRAAGGPAAGPAALPNLFPAYEPQGELVTVPGGSAAIVDQRAYKQTVIDGYDRAMSFARPFYNLVGRIRLPRPNTALNHAYVTHFRAEDPYALIRAVLERGRRYDHLLFGFTESDPHLHAARAFRPVEYTSSIYTVAFDDGDDFHDRLLARPRALDLSAI